MFEIHVLFIFNHKASFLILLHIKKERNSIECRSNITGRVITIYSIETKLVQNKCLLKNSTVLSLSDKIPFIIHQLVNTISKRF